MDNWILALMLVGSLLLGGFGLMAFMWGLRTGQFDDEEKFKHGALFDGEDELNEAYKREKNKKI